MAGRLADPSLASSEALLHNRPVRHYTTTLPLRDDPPNFHDRGLHPMARFEGIDFYDISALLSEEERMVRDTVRGWVEDALMPIIGKAYVERRFPKELIPGLAELGVLGANLPEEYGCAGLNNVAYGLIMQELERGDSGIRSFASVQGALVM
jgi:glutaryl-CoA dehydrogenase